MLDINISILKNKYTEEALAARQEGKKIYIFGAGVAGQIVEKQFLEPYGIKADYYVEDDNFFNGERSILGIPVIPYTKVNPIDTEILLLVAYCFSFPNVFDFPTFNIKGKVFIGDPGTFAGCRITDGIFDSNFFKENYDSFNNFYDLLSDNESKIIMKNFIKSRITSNCDYLKDVWHKNQYFDSTVIDLKKITKYVDCGAYTGDTYEDLIRNFNNWNGIAYLLDPEKENIEILKNKYEKNENINIIPKGAWNEKKELFFSNTRGDTGFVSSDGVKIEVDTIDNILDGKCVDFIKMDIEGSEYNALLGAKRTIQEFVPTLAICVYHKKDDLIKIPELIHSFNDDYNFYLRIYKPYSLELVLYAIKKR
ncbi:MAG: FkbM family methyltransferase [Treponema sp.]|nr:FkbM family methyltransferase [Treponema sp.]